MRISIFIANPKSPIEIENVKIRMLDEKQRKDHGFLGLNVR